MNPGPSLPGWRVQAEADFLFAVHRTVSGDGCCFGEHPFHGVSAWLLVGYEVSGLVSPFIWPLLPSSFAGLFWFCQIPTCAWFLQEGIPGPWPTLGILIASCVFLHGALRLVTVSVDGPPCWGTSSLKAGKLLRFSSVPQLSCV